MAATKSRSTRSQSSRSGGKARGGASKGQGRKRGQTKQRTSSASSRTRKRSTSATRNGPPSGLARVASKAKAPALAGGAALVGFAGGAAVSRARRRNGLRGRVAGLGSSIQRKLPRRDTAARTVGNVAGEVARRSTRVGQIASEVQKATEWIDSRSRGKG
jgi:hypothetical protein